LKEMDKVWRFFKMNFLNIF